LWDVLGVKAIEGTNFAASFDHMAMLGYDANYYAYLVSISCIFVSARKSFPTNFYPASFFHQVLKK
jgi:hypothetical protein